MKHHGYITLISVLIVSAVGVAVTVSLLMSGLASSSTSFALEQSQMARAFANACAEEALEQIRGNTAYTGSGDLTFSEGGCAYTVVSAGGDARTVTSTGTVGTIVRKLTAATTALSPQIVLSSWQEVADF